MTYSPKVFVSYSHDSDQHKKWVTELATDLRKNSVDVILDVWDLKPGDSTTDFMEKVIDISDRIIAVCTKNYNRKANEGVGGVGYERMILTAENEQLLSSNKIVPIIRNIPENKKLPKFMGTRLYIDFSEDIKYKSQFDILLRELLQEPLFKKPELGRNPFTSKKESEIIFYGGQHSYLKSVSLKGRLNNMGDSITHKVELNSLSCVELSVLDDANFDVYIKRDAQPAFDDYEYRDYGIGTSKTINIESSKPGVYYFMVHSYSGSGSYLIKIDAVS